MSKHCKFQTFGFPVSYVDYIELLYVGVVSFNKILYAIGGCNGTESLSSVEVYCARNDKWTILPKSLSMKRNFVGVVLLDMPPNL